MASTRTEFRRLETAWDAEPEFSTSFPLEIQPIYATFLVLAFILFIGAGLLSDTKGFIGSTKFIIYAAFAALTLGYGAIFLVDSFGVYT